MLYQSHFSLLSYKFAHARTGLHETNLDMYVCDINHRMGKRLCIGLLVTDVCRFSFNPIIALYIFISMSQVVDYLVEKQAVPIDIGSKDGTTPLHLACYAAGPATVRLLITRHSADALRTNKFGCSVLHWTAMGGQLPVLDYLTSGRHHSSDKQELGKLNLDWGQQQQHGHTPLHKAALKGHYKVPTNKLYQ